MFKPGDLIVSRKSNFMYEFIEYHENVLRIKILDKGVGEVGVEFNSDHTNFRLAEQENIAHLVKKKITNDYV